MLSEKSERNTQIFFVMERGNLFPSASFHLTPLRISRECRGYVYSWEPDPPGPFVHSQEVRLQTCQ